MYVFGGIRAVYSHALGCVFCSGCSGVILAEPGRTGCCRPAAEAIFDHRLAYGSFIERMRKEIEHPNRFPPWYH